MTASTSTQTWQHYQAICELKSRYCRLMDTKQWQQWGELFTDDIELDVSDDVPPELGDAITRGRDQVVAHVSGFVGQAITVHQVHSPEVSWIDDNTVSVIWAMSDVVTWPEPVQPPVPGGRILHGYGHYHERYRYEAGQWRIAYLKLTRLHIVTQ